MTTEEIDFKALFEQVQRENEALRLEKLNRRFEPSFSWLDALRIARDFATDHYTAILVAVMVSYYLGMIVVNTYRMLRGPKHE